MNDLHNLRTGLGMDVHAFAPGRKLILGGVDIPHHQGLDGHSDADVLAHAISDALLGAVRGGDIGKLFPDTDPAYKDADSLKLLAEVARFVRERGFEIIDVDSVIAAQAPKLSPYREAMRENLAAARGKRRRKGHHHRALGPRGSRRRHHRLCHLPRVPHLTTIRT